MADNIRQNHSGIGDNIVNKHVTDKPKDRVVDINAFSGLYAPESFAVIKTTVGGSEAHGFAQSLGIALLKEQIGCNYYTNVTTGPPPFAGLIIECADNERSCALGASISRALRPLHIPIHISGDGPLYGEGWASLQILVGENQ